MSYWPELGPMLISETITDKKAWDYSYTSVSQPELEGGGGFPKIYWLCRVKKKVGLY